MLAQLAGQIAYAPAPESPCDSLGLCRRIASQWTLSTFRTVATTLKEPAR
jgi:hypothetical protein